MNDLRDQMEEAIRRVGLARNLASYSSAAWVVIKPVLDAKDTEIERLTEERDAARMISAGRTMEEYDYEDLKQRLDLAEAAIDRVRAMHQPVTRGGLTICGHCSGWNGSRCRGMVQPHPCPTLAALDQPEES